MIVPIGGKLQYIPTPMDYSESSGDLTVTEFVVIVALTLCIATLVVIFANRGR